MLCLFKDNEIVQVTGSSLNGWNICFTVASDRGNEGEFFYLTDSEVEGNTSRILVPFSTASPERIPITS